MLHPSASVFSSMFRIFLTKPIVKKTPADFWAGDWFSGRETNQSCFWHRLSGILNTQKMSKSREISSGYVEVSGSTITCMEDSYDELENIA